jgi:diphosphomevalonate decarboxylase
VNQASARACPSLALLKYWGKLDRRENTTATPSVAVTLGGLYTDTTATVSSAASEADRVELDDRLQPSDHYRPFFDRLRRELGSRQSFHTRSHNSFPTAAGLASSSSGFAALAASCAWAAGADLAPERLSAVARLGSASAARAIYGGFVLLDRGARAAEQLHGPEHWRELRILVVVTAPRSKEFSSREAMESSRLHSPYYRDWVRSSGRLLPETLRAVADRDLERLGELARLSAFRMHAVMLASRPPLCYWLPETVAAFAVCAELRRRGIGAWETMDAGPQVKVLCLERDLPKIEEGLRAALPATELIVACPGPGVTRT